MKAEVEAYPAIAVIIPAIIAAVIIIGCEDKYKWGREGEFTGRIVNSSEYTINVDSPVNKGKYVTLEPGQWTEYSLRDEIYTFKAYYASDGKPCASVSFRINSVKEDALDRHGYRYSNMPVDWVVDFIRFKGTSFFEFVWHCP